MKPLFASTPANLRRLYALFIFCLVIGVYLYAGTLTRADDGYRLWLRYESLPTEKARAYQTHVSTLR